MKTFLLFVSIIAAATGGVIAQPAPGTLFSVNGPTTATEIISKSAHFDLKARTAIYLGDVRVKDPRIELSCEVLTVKLDGSGGKFQNMIAETNVVMECLDHKGQKIRGTGGKAIYTYNVTATYTNDVMELMDNPILQTAQGTWQGDVITLDRGKNTVKVTNSRMHITQPAGTTNQSILGPTP